MIAWRSMIGISDDERDPWERWDKDEKRKIRNDKKWSVRSIYDIIKIEVLFERNKNEYLRWKVLRKIKKNYLKYTYPYMIYINYYIASSLLSFPCHELPSEREDFSSLWIIMECVDKTINRKWMAHQPTDTIPWVQLRLCIQICYIFSLPGWFSRDFLKSTAIKMWFFTCFLTFMVPWVGLPIIVLFWIYLKPLEYENRGGEQNRGTGCFSGGESKSSAGNPARKAGNFDIVKQKTKLRKLPTSNADTESHAAAAAAAVVLLRYTASYQYDRLAATSLTVSCVERRNKSEQHKHVSSLVMLDSKTTTTTSSASIERSDKRALWE